MLTYMDVILAPKYALQVDHFSDLDAIKVQCIHCGHVSIITGPALRRKYPAHMLIRSIDKHFICAKCGPGWPVTWSTVRRFDSAGAGQGKTVNS